MTDIRKSLESLADAIEQISNTPKDSKPILDRELSGNKINGGTITNFASQGIKDEATSGVVVVKNDGIHVDAMHVNVVQNDLAVKGNLTVDGAVHAKKLHVEEITSDVRHERSDPLSFVNVNNSIAYGKGLVWPGGEYTKQFILQQRPDRFFSTESLDLNQGKNYYIAGQEVLSQTALGNSVTKSNIKQLGTLSKLDVDGPLNVDNFIIYDANTERLGLGTDVPNGALSISNLDHELIIDSNDRNEFVIGSYTNVAINLITDDTERLTITETGSVVVHSKTTFKDKISVGVKNFNTDADITTAGPVRFQGKKFEVSDEIPTSGNYNVGDIVWNSNPRPAAYVGWICIKTGSPGDWKPFAQISS
jgi:hypothetical protein